MQTQGPWSAWGGPLAQASWNAWPRELFRLVIVPVATVAIAFAMRSVVLRPLIGNRGPLITFFLAIVASVAVGGLGPGLVATALSVMTASYFFYDPPGYVYPRTFTDSVIVGYFAMTGVVVSVMGGMLHRSRARESKRTGEIAEEREKLRISLASIGDAVMAVDTGRRVTFMNPAAEGLTGWSKQDAEGKIIDDVFRIVDERDRRPLPSPVEHVFGTRREVGPSSSPILMGRDGIERPIDESTSPIRDASGVLVGAMLIFRDITEKKRAESAVRNSEERLRLATSAADIGIWDYDPESGRLTCDDRARRHLGIPAGSAGGYEDLLAGIHPLDRQRLDEAVKAALAHDVPELDSELRAVAGEEVDHWVEAKARLLPGGAGGSARLIGTTFDISARKRAEETLREADRRKNEFLATLAHELRNPLAPIRTGLQIMKIARSEDNQLKAHAMMERQVGHMVRLIDDLLDISRITRGKIALKKERVDLRDILESAIEASQPFMAAGQHGLSVEIPDGPMPVEADPTRLVQVFSNLLNNAAKYTPDRGSVRITAGRHDGLVAVTVEDNGVGIAREMLDEVFEMFAQGARNLDRAQGGLGIGLTLVRKLSEMHGGSVVAESGGPGAGSSFTVRLPMLGPIEPASPSAIPPDGADRTKGTTPGLEILVVDDNIDAAQSLAILLGLHGHGTRTVHSGADALAEYDRYRPDIVFLDIGLPGLDGHEVARRIRGRRDPKRPILIALTGWGSEEDRQRSREAGFDEHLTKPVDVDRVELLLEMLVGTPEENRPSRMSPPVGWPGPGEPQGQACPGGIGRAAATLGECGGDGDLRSSVSAGS